jgi:hypothetical protein
VNEIGTSRNTRFGDNAQRFRETTGTGRRLQAPLSPLLHQRWPLPHAEDVAAHGRGGLADPPQPQPGGVVGKLIGEAELASRRQLINTS